MGILHKWDFVVFLALGVIWLMLKSCDLGAATWPVLVGGILLGAFGTFGWRWFLARRELKARRREALFLNPVFLERLNRLPEADQESLVRKLAEGIGRGRIED